MNRETTTMFRDLPEVHIQRSKLEKPHNLQTTWSVGDIVPIYVDDILPGTTVSMKMASVMRMQTPLYPTYGELMTDILFFFVPYRLVWTHWKEFWGENTNAWTPNLVRTVPQLKTNTSNRFKAKSVADYMGLPTEIADISVSALPFRGYVKIWNDWFRSTPLQNDAAFSTGDSDENAATTAADPMLYSYRGGALLKANKLHDYFTSALKDAQRGPEVTLPLGNWAPVYPRSAEITTTSETTLLKWRTTGAGTNFVDNTVYPLYAEKDTNTVPHWETKVGSGNTATVTGTVDKLFPANLWTDLKQATSASITALRQSIAVQHFYEALARYGTRYTEFLRGIFGVVSSDARLQRSEYLGGVRVPHNIATVLQTSSTDATSPQGNTGAYSHTVHKDENLFTKSFEEHGVLIGVLCTRYKHSYSQGIHAMWSRKNWYDFYLPQFANLSEVEIKNKEIYAQGTSQDEETFGYQEYGASYRYMPDQVTSEMRPSYATSLDAWHYGDEYASLPTLGASWIQEDRSNIDRTLVVNSGTADQLFGDFYFEPTYVLPMPIYSIPGLDKI